MPDPRPTYSAEDLKAQSRGDMYADPADNLLLQAISRLRHGLPTMPPESLSPDHQLIWNTADEGLRMYNALLERALRQRRNEKGFRYDGR